METQMAHQIIDTLARGIHPVSGEPFPEDSPYNAPPVIRALHVAARALQGAPAEPRARRPAPANAGKPWSDEDDAALVAAFEAGTDLRDVSDALGRTKFGLEQRLIKLGKTPTPAGGGRYPSAAG